MVLLDLRDVWKSFGDTAVLKGMNLPEAPTTRRRPLHMEEQQQPVIRPDLDNYDDDEDEEEEMMDGKPAATATTANASESEQIDEEKKDDSNGKQVTFEDDVESDKKRKANDSATTDDKPKAKRGRKRKNPRPTPEELAYKDALEQIPFGTMGAKMMTTFGDGPTPQPAALEAALLGTRQTLKVAVMDARKVRRRLQQDFFDAQSSVDPKLNKANRDRQRRAERKERLAKAASRKEEDDDSDDDEEEEANANLPPAKPRAEVASNSLAPDPRLVFRALQEGSD